MGAEHFYFKRKQRFIPLVDERTTCSSPSYIREKKNRMKTRISVYCLSLISFLVSLLLSALSFSLFTTLFFFVSRPLSRTNSPLFYRLLSNSRALSLSSFEPFSPFKPLELSLLFPENSVFFFRLLALTLFSKAL